MQSYIIFQGERFLHLSANKPYPYPYRVVYEYIEMTQIS